MIRGMFVTYGMDQCHRDDYDTDASLEHSEEDLRDLFLEFYHDVLPEFQSLGRVVQFKARRAGSEITIKAFSQHLIGLIGLF